MAIQLDICGGLIHWRQFQGILLVTALGYTGRCNDCGREHAQKKRPRLGQTCVALARKLKRSRKSKQ